MEETRNQTPLEPFQGEPKHHNHKFWNDKFRNRNLPCKNVDRKRRTTPQHFRLLKRNMFIKKEQRGMV